MNSKKPVISNERVEPPLVLPPWADDGQTVLSESHFFRESGEWLDRVLNEKTYGAPRVFDLFTLLAVTLAFAVLLGSLRLMQPVLAGNLAMMASSIGLFVAGLAAFQAFLWRGGRPRLASLIAGPCLLFVLIVVSGVRQPQELLDWSRYVRAFCSAIAFGVPAGYSGGAMVAGVFLIADAFRRRFMPPAEPQPANDDEIFEKDGSDGIVAEHHQ